MALVGRLRTVIDIARLNLRGLVQRTSDGVSTVNKVWDDQNLLQERDGALVTNVQYTDFPV